MAAHRRGLTLAILGYVWGMDESQGLFITGVVMIPPLWIVDLVDFGGVPASLAQATPAAGTAAAGAR